MLQQHQVEVHIPRDLPLVRFDALLIERVLVNLLENASKYTPPGSKVTVAAEVIGDQLSVSVSDNGPGLPAGREEAVFQKFTRGERESATPGVGLGLADLPRHRRIASGQDRRRQPPRRRRAVHLHLAAGNPAAGRGRSRDRRCLSRCRWPFWSRTSAKFGVSCARPWRPKGGACTRPKPCGRV